MTNFGPYRLPNTGSAGTNKMPLSTNDTIMGPYRVKMRSVVTNIGLGGANMGRVDDQHGACSDHCGR